MVVTFIGMSNIGKTYRANSLHEEKGWIHIDCDKLISEELKDELSVYPPELSDTEKMARWMGFPYDPQYGQNSKKYKVKETQVMRRVADRIKNLSPEERENQNFVIDTTGSFIYTDWDVQSEIIGKGVSDEVVHLINSVPNKKHVRENFIEFPKPVIFEDGIIIQLPNETQLEGLLRAHSELMERRELKYEKIRTVGIKPDYLKGVKTAEGFLAAFEKSILERDTPPSEEGSFRRRKEG